ncbi:DUF2017 family protein [Labedella endophytica]|uniref:DUF2017 family protein n=1 Tax=Labedella endophytica TaxID=1523160 RepID=A0A3S0VUA1_9MICO|nr:DUF2017 family protein [Labedella endophytica]RUR01644.1 DUF2017 family protein [Labedella endophytica]
MTAFGVTDAGDVLARFDAAETRILLSLSGQLAEMLADVAEPSAGLDPAIGRLFPDAYREDPDASAEFSRFTRTDLAAAKVAAASTVQRSLASTSASDDDPSPSSVAGAGAVPSSSDAEFVLDTEAGWSWLRHLTDLRLTIAARLGVVDDPNAFDEEPDPAQTSDDDLLARGLFDWLGYVQELLIAALEEGAAVRAAGNGGTGTASPPV